MICLRVAEARAATVGGGGCGIRYTPGVVLCCSAAWRSSWNLLPGSATVTLNQSLANTLASSVVSCKLSFTVLVFSKFTVECAGSSHN